MIDSATWAKIFLFDKKDRDLDKDGLNSNQVEIFVSSDNHDKLVNPWTSWNNVTSVKMGEDFKIYVELSNKGTVANSSYFEQLLQYYRLGNTFYNSFDNKVRIRIILQTTIKALFV